jgi:hypothetical protein
VSVETTTEAVPAVDRGVLLERAGLWRSELAEVRSRLLSVSLEARGVAAALRDAPPADAADAPLLGGVARELVGHVDEARDRLLAAIQAAAVLGQLGAL